LSKPAQPRRSARNGAAAALRVDDKGRRVAARTRSSTSLAAGSTVMPFLRSSAMRVACSARLTFQNSGSISRTS